MMGKKPKPMTVSEACRRSRNERICFVCDQRIPQGEGACIGWLSVLICDSEYCSGVIKDTSTEDGKRVSKRDQLDMIHVLRVLIKASR